MNRHEILTLRALTLIRTENPTFPAVPNQSPYYTHDSSMQEEEHSTMNTIIYSPPPPSSMQERVIWSLTLNRSHGCS